MLTPAQNGPNFQRCQNAPTVGTPRRWRRLVRVAYFDEAGVADEKQEPYLVVAGVMIHGDDQWFPVENQAQQIVDTQVPESLREGFEFHATHLFSDHPKFKKLISAERRFTILREFLAIIAKLDLPVSYGAITREPIVKTLSSWKVERRTSMARQWALDSCVLGFQGWFNRTGSNEVAICIADRAHKLEPTLRKGFASLRRVGLGYLGMPADPLLTLFNFIDALHFADSAESIGLQLADCAAFFIKRHLMGKSDSEEFYRIIEPHLVIYSAESALWRGPD
jgi:Protein of unknown function (DUF3800)